jgi:hypothetical protein
VSHRTFLVEKGDARIETFQQSVGNMCLLSADLPCSITTVLTCEEGFGSPKTSVGADLNYYVCILYIF